MIRAGIDIGGTKINIGLVDEGNQLIYAKKLRVADITEPVSAIGAVIDSLLASAGRRRDELVFCGIGIPGTVSSDGRKILKAPNIRILPADFADRMEKAFGIPCRMVQDSRAAAWGEFKAGAARGMRSVICVTLGTGIGTGIVLDGKIYNGALGCAGEMGHLPVVENGRPCGCGRRGCLEKYAAGLGLDMTAAEILGEESTADTLFASARAGNADAEKAIREAVIFLGRALVAEINLLSPDCLLLSGGLAQRKEYTDAVIDYVCSHCYITDTMPRIERASLGENAPLIGAALLNET